MSKKTPATYGNDSISSLKGADRVRLRPGVIFGSDGLEGCEHSFFEILSNSIDEAREGYGNEILVTRYADGSLEVEDFGRGVPMGYNEKEGRFNWELVYCELYAGGKYNNDEGESYEYSLGLNGLGACATQYASEWFEVTVLRDKTRYELRFERGEPAGELQQTPYSGKRTGTVTRWKPDREVFTDIAIPPEFFHDLLKRQAVVNAGLTFVFRDETAPGSFEESRYCYENGIVDYLAELVGEDALTAPYVARAERQGRDREDKPLYKVKFEVAFAFSTRVQRIEYYHNSSFLEHGGSPDKAVRSAFVSAIDAHLKAAGKYNKNESKVTFADVADCLVLISNSHSTRTSYENQTKKAINNKFIADSMTAFLKEQAGNLLFGKPCGPWENPRPGVGQQTLEGAGRKGQNQFEENAVGRHRHGQPRAEVCRLPHEGSRAARAVYRGGRFGPGRLQAGPGRRVSGHHPGARENSQLPQKRL